MRAIYFEGTIMDLRNEVFGIMAGVVDKGYILQSRCALCRTETTLYMHIHKLPCF